MEKIQQYHKFTDIKPPQHELIIPYFKTGKLKIMATLDELELYYDSALKMYVSEPNKKIKTGGDSGQILVLECLFD
jgi:hypothetical protein